MTDVDKTDKKSSSAKWAAGLLIGSLSLTGLSTLMAPGDTELPERAPAVPEASSDPQEPFLDIEHIANTGEIMTSEGPLEELTVPAIPVEEPAVEAEDGWSIWNIGQLLGFWGSVVGLIWLANSGGQEEPKKEKKDGA